jgi:hypothetical protein
MRRFLPLLLVAAACEQPLEIHPDVGLTAAVVVSPQFLSPGDIVTVTVRVTNLNEAPLELRFPNECVFAYVLLDAGEEIAAPTTGCGSSATNHEFPTGISEQVFTFAVGDAAHPIGAGTYQVYGGLGFPMVIVSEPEILQVNVPEFRHAH